jgi:hypothetical protein
VCVCVYVGVGVGGGGVGCELASYAGPRSENPVRAPVSSHGASGGIVIMQKHLYLPSL